MSDMLYIQIDKNLKITSPKVRLDSIAQLFCKNPEILDACKQLYVYEVPNHRPGRYVMSALDLINVIQENVDDVEISHIGEPVFILTYEKQDNKGSMWNWMKTILISAITFVGTGFAIMSFNIDSDTSRLFRNVYWQMTGEVSDGFTELEVMYSLGIGIGVIFFFNHFGRKKISEDPTPLQVQMRIYEDNVDMTVMEEISRSQGGE